jgi:hypothetical protein
VATALGSYDGTRLWLTVLAVVLLSAATRSGSGGTSPITPGLALSPTLRA